MSICSFVFFPFRFQERDSGSDCASSWSLLTFSYFYYLNENSLNRHLTVSLLHRIAGSFSFIIHQTVNVNFRTRINAKSVRQAVLRFYLI